MMFTWGPLVIVVNGYESRRSIPVAILNRFVLPAVTDFPPVCSENLIRHRIKDQTG